MKISFMPSASVCRMPNGPALFGPTRFCMPAMTLRSNQTMNIVATQADGEDDEHLEQRRSAAASTAVAPIEQRVEGEHYNALHVRTSSGRRGGVDELADVGRRRLNGTQIGAAGRRRRRA